jgi:hypothetical protein
MGTLHDHDLSTGVEVQEAEQAARQRAALLAPVEAELYARFFRYSLTQHGCACCTYSLMHLTAGALSVSSSRLLALRRAASRPTWGACAGADWCRLRALENRCTIVSQTHVCVTSWRLVAR